MDKATPIVRSNISQHDQTLAALKSKIKEQEDILANLRSTTTSIETEPSTNSRLYLEQIRILASTYQSLSNEEPYIPPYKSSLPELLAMHVTLRIIGETQIAITQIEALLKDTYRNIEKERADLEDAKLIQKQLSVRIDSLKEGIGKYSQKDPKILAQEKIKDLEIKKKNYDSKTSNLMMEFNAFIDEYLAPMLAVEELGGPIVGEIIDANDEILGSRFSAHGKVRKAKLSEDQRQKRITEIWGTGSQEGEIWDEKFSAASEMRELTEKLLNKMADADGDISAAYIKLDRESAAARFLVRSKVAQFHPTNARKLRLISFGGEIGD